MRTAPFTVLLLVPLAAWAAEPAPAERAELTAAVVVLTFDRLDAGCRTSGAYSAAQRSQIDQWQQHNAVGAVRARLPQLQRDAELARKLDQSATQIVQMARQKGARDCDAAASLTRIPDAQFGQVVPAVVAPAPDAVVSSSTRTAPSSAPSSATSAPAAGVAPRPAVASATLLASIDSFGFATRPKMGIGGFIALDIYPIVLFKSGEVLKDVPGLAYPGGLAAHRAAHADEWTRWRRAGGKLQLLDDGKWDDMEFQTYARLPADLRLNGRFRSLSGTGNLAVGGSQSVTVVDEYRFTADGRVVRSGAVGSTAAAGDTSVVRRGGPRERRGRYRMDGLLLRIDYEDGPGEARILIADPKDPDGVIWLDGESYVQR